MPLRPSGTNGNQNHRSVTPEIVDQSGRPIGQPRSAQSVKKDREPQLDLGAIPELIGAFFLFIKSPQGLICILAGVIIFVVIPQNIDQYPPVLRFIGWSANPNWIDCFSYWGMIQALELVGGISLASRTLQAAGFLAERGRAYPEVSNSQNASQIAIKRRKKLQSQRDTQMFILWAISIATYIYDIATLSASGGDFFNAVGDPNFSLIFRVAITTLLFDFLVLVIVILREFVPNRAARDFLGALARGEVVKMPDRVGDWQNPSK